MNYMSQIGQDEWVLNTLKEKRNGIFVDVGGGHPVKINNTYTLEKEYGWTGVSIDKGPPHTRPRECMHLTLEQYKNLWNSERVTPIICGDALQIDYEKIFEENELPERIDYLSVDLDPPMVTYRSLLRIPFSKYTFNVITFETDFYRDEKTRGPSQEFLQNLGYVLKHRCQQEDWYVHSSLKH